MLHEEVELRYDELESVVQDFLFMEQIRTFLPVNVSHIKVLLIRYEHSIVFNYSTKLFIFLDYNNIYRIETSNKRSFTAKNVHSWNFGVAIRSKVTRKNNHAVCH